MKKLLLLLILLPSLSYAQTPIPNPTGIDFDSTDHNTVAGDNINIVSSYIIEYYAAGASSPLATAEVTRANVTPVSGNTYRILFSQLPAYPIGLPLRAKINSRGPGGTSNSNNSLSADSFLRPVPVPAAPTLITIRP